MNFIYSLTIKLHTKKKYYQPYIMNGVPVMMMPPSVAYDGTSVPMIAPDGSLMISHIPTQPDQSNMIMDPNASV
jgi:hypothetical protein